MTEYNVLEHSAVEMDNRDVWVRPVVKRLQAGAAEVDLDTTNDGVIATDS